MTQRIVVIGGGIAGLSAAYRAHELSSGGPGAAEVLLLESRAELGGKVRTAADAGHIFERGPNAFISPGPELSKLVELSGVEVLSADPAAKRRFLCKGGALHELDTNPIALLKSGVMSATAKLRALAEPTIGKRTSEHGNHASDGWGDESVESFFTRRFGAKMAAVFAGPLVSGIYAGDPKRLSLPACFPRLAAMESEHGSIIRGMSALRKEGVKIPTLQTPSTGMQSIPLGLGAAAPFVVRTGVSVSSMSPAGEGWELSLSDGEHVDASAVVIATPSYAAADLLQSTAVGTAAALAKISHPHLAVVSLVYAADQAALAPKGFGALYVHDGSSDLLGVLHESHIFPSRGVGGSLHLRVMMGGATRPELADRTDAELTQLAIEELAALHGFTSAPTQTLVTRWPDSIPQYDLGHARLIKDALDGLQASSPPPVALAGNYLSGVSLSDTAASGVQAAEAVQRQL